MKKYLTAALLFLPSLSFGGFTTDWLRNTSSSVTLNGTTYYWQAGTGSNGQALITDGGVQPILTFGTVAGAGGGGASSLEVFNNNDATRSSPTASIGLSNAFRGTVSGSTYTFRINFASVASQADLANYLLLTSTPIFLSTSVAADTYLSLSSAAATYLNLLMPYVSSINVAAPLTITGNGMAGSTPTLGVDGSSVTLKGQNVAVLTATQTFSGRNTFTNEVTISTTVTGLQSIRWADGTVQTSSPPAGGGGGGTPGGAELQLQYHAPGGTFGGIAQATYSATTNTLTIGATTIFQNTAQVSMTNLSSMSFTGGAVLIATDSANGSKIYAGQIVWNDGTIQVSSPTAGGGSGDIEGVTAGSGLSGGGTSGTVALSLDPNATHYIHNQNTLQTGATFYVSSGTVQTSLRLDYATAGSVLFAGSDKSISQNNSGLFFDTSNGYLGIGTSTPLGLLHQRSTDPTALGMIVGWDTATPITDVDFVRFRFVNGLADAASFGYRPYGAGGAPTDTAGFYFQDTNGIRMAKISPWADADHTTSLHIASSPAITTLAGKGTLNVYGTALIGATYANGSTTPPQNGMQVEGKAVFASSMTLSGNVLVQNVAPTTGQVLKYDGTNWAPGTDNNSGGGGSSSLAVGTGTAANFTTNVTSPTAAISFLGTQFKSVAGGTTNFISLNQASVTVQGVLTAGSNITLTPGAGTLTIAASASGSVSGSTGAIGISIDGGGSAIVAGSTRSVTVPYACTISSWTVVADVSGSISVRVASSTYANYPTLSYMSTGGNPPSLSSQQKNAATPTSWTGTSLGQGSVVSFVIDSASTVTWVNIILWVIKS